jgi:hypothetical protein
MNILHGSGLYINNPVTPRDLVVLLNLAVIDWHKNEWETRVGITIIEPEFSPGWCRTKRCTNAAIV